VPKPLTRQRILEAAFAQADADGLESITMRSVAGRLKVEAMSLYHHVPNKRAMLDGLVDHLIRVANLPTGEVTVEQWIRGTADGLRTFAQQHPQVAPLLSSRTVPLEDPRAAEPFEAGLAAFRGEGRYLAEAFAAVQSVALSLLSLTQLEATARLQDPAATESGISGLERGRFPNLAEVTAETLDLGAFWDTLVEALVKGFAAPP
jgi:AcrR family transcriptional regulator